MKKSIVLIIFFLLFFGCKSENLDNDEYAVINLVIATHVEPSLKQIRSNISTSVVSSPKTVRFKNRFFCCFTLYFDSDL